MCVLTISSATCETPRTKSIGGVARRAVPVFIDECKVTCNLAQNMQYV